MLKAVSVSVLLSIALCGCDSGTKASEISNGNEQAKSVTQSQKASYGVLAIDSVKQIGTKAEIKGSTDLPDDSVIAATIELYVKDPNATYVGNDGKATVKDGKWQTTIEFPKVADFAKGPHDATALFTPRSQSEAVLALVGKDGEKLKGKGVRKTMGFNLIEATKRVKLTVSKTKTSIPNPDKYSSSDPRHAVALMLQRWKSEDWNTLAKEATMSGPSSIQDRKKQADNWLGIRRLEGATIDSVDTRGLISSITVKVRYAVGSNLSEETMGFVALKVDANAQPTERGMWRVNLEGIRNGGF